VDATPTSDAVPVALREVMSSGPVQGRVRTGEYCVVTKKTRAGSDSEAPRTAVPSCEVLDARDGKLTLRVNATILQLGSDDARALAEMIWRALQRSTPP
jgi:hypothetical protein